MLVLVTSFGYTEYVYDNIIVVVKLIIIINLYKNNIK
jgi:hypothetical protein